MQASNTRVHSRVQLRRRCWCESGSITIYAQIGNVSEGGLFVKTFAPLSEGSRTRVSWDFGEEDGAVEAEAVVVWRRAAGQGGEAPSGMGLRFEDLDADARSRIRRYVEGMVGRTGGGAAGA